MKLSLPQPLPSLLEFPGTIAAPHPRQADNKDEEVLRDLECIRDIYEPGDHDGLTRVRDNYRKSILSFGLRLLRLLDIAPGEVDEAAETHRRSLRNPPKTKVEYLKDLQLQGLRESVAKNSKGKP